ncbi:nitroimidazol reductase NimA-like FMN-containing flavoprotein (pyridoxamine 5'-phosphate oxidase superfamily) [Kitasatospora sp. GP30]|uniref:helix-turn-helix domain-containing protein n=1 Tax=Kitasatospora sp. GP30 TaxID=3035084 RepID=UPI000CB335BF|nr:pyridoxamine 5'-phosphate oxidase family protein [Kitasatospora sp. GP30]MDH6144317.1 nitroimidazol reductase NimA-like FMN-containing flavoprotein (pyridoxamine 5'-phosphate oxidase superfamily) [Kitasatospora sp. GP30]
MNPRPAPADVARRIAERSAQLGLTEGQLANQAGMAPRYLRQLVEADTGFDPSGLLRVAAALHLTYQELLEGRRDPPSGQGGAPSRPVLVRLTTSECWDKLGTHGVGRVVLLALPAPLAFPVNYTVDAETVVYRTTPHGAAAAESGAAVSFQVDHIDDHLRRGWSVLITGTAHHVNDPDTVRQLDQLPGTEPWAGGDRPLWVSVAPDQITGRRVGPG